MENKRVLVYDSYGSPLPSKKIFLKRFGEFTKDLYYITHKNLVDGIQANAVLDLFRSGLDYVLIWNGHEIGCNLIEGYCKTYGVNYCFLEQGLLPQNKTLFFGNKSKILTYAPSTFSPTRVRKYRKKILQHYSFVRSSDINPKKIVIPMQVSFDASLRSMKRPRNDFFKSVLCQNKIKDSEIYLCPHPKHPNDYKNFDLSLLGNYKVSNKKTLEEAQDCAAVLGFNSTTLYETFLLDIPTFSFMDARLENGFTTKGFFNSVEYHQLFVDDFSKEELALKLINHGRI